MGSLWKDERGAYQVPIWNAAVEYEHLDMVYNDMVALKSNVGDVVLSKAPKSAQRGEILLAWMWQNRYSTKCGQMGYRE